METPWSLVKTRIHAGVWEGVLSAADPTAEPDVAVTHLDAPLQSVTLAPMDEEPGQWALRIAIPADLLGDGVQTFVITDTASGEKLGAFTIVTGEPLEDDIRAEMDLLRAELDMLKRAFRRHCLETM